MGRLRLFCALLILSATAFAQRTYTAAQLVESVKSSIQLRNKDQDVANFVKGIKLTTKLEAKTVEDLQGLGAGTRTVAALKLQVLASQSLGIAALSPASEPYIPPPPPSEEEKKKALVEVTEYALDYTKNLPNFICNQITTRHVDPTGTGENFRTTDKIQEQLSFVDGQEKYKVVAINGISSTVDHNKVGGATSSGEFASMLYEIFQPESHTEFEWTRWGTLRNRRMHVFSYRVPQIYSSYRVLDGQSGRVAIPGYHGLVYVDRDTNTVMRITMDGDGLEDFPINMVHLQLDYDYVTISDREFLLPLKSELQSRQGRYLSLNELEFRLYRRFGAEATFIVDDSDPIPADKLKEQPAKPDAKGK